MLKRIIAIFLLIATLSCLLVPTASAATTTKITASSEKYPTSITQGSSFGLRGVYTTNFGSITRVEATVKTSSGATIYTFAASPNVKSFSVNGTRGSSGKTLDSTFAFGKLAVGTYTLEIRLHANGSTAPTYTVKKTFKITSSGTTNTTPTITASSEQYPTNIKQGSSFGLRGVYTTNVGTITSVSATLKNVYGSQQYYYFSATPNVKSFNVNGTVGSNGKTLNSTIAFGSLSIGTYTLQINITAKNGTASKTHTVTKTFAIIAPTTTPTISASSEQYPTNIKQGSSFSLRGVYTTNVGTITSVSATVKNSAGATKYNFSATPNVKSFNVTGTRGTNGKTLDGTVAFGSLAAGTYTLEIKITAKNGTATKTHTVKKTFTITGTTYATPTITATSEQYPTSIAKGSSFNLRGIYTTNVGTISSVNASIKTSAGATIYTFTASPNVKSFNVGGTTGTNGKSLDSTFTFGKLATGTYTLQINITAKNGTASKTHTVTRTFTISSTASDGSYWRTYYHVNNQGAYCYNKYHYPSEAAEYKIPEDWFKVPGQFYKEGKIGQNSYLVVTVEDLSGTPTYPENNPNNRFLKSYFMVWRNNARIPAINKAGESSANACAWIEVIYSSGGIDMVDNYVPYISLKMDDGNPCLFVAAEGDLKVWEPPHVDWTGIVKLVVSVGKNLATDNFVGLIQNTATLTTMVYTAATPTQSDNGKTIKFNYGTLASRYSDDYLKARALELEVSDIRLNSRGHHIRLDFDIIHPEDTPADYNTSANEVIVITFNYRFKTPGGIYVPDAPCTYKYAY